MNFSAELSELWESFGGLCEELAHDGHKLVDLVQRNPQFWHWLTVWLGLVWLCMRWSKIVADANERRIIEAAEARLVVLVQEDEADGDGRPDLVSEEPAPAAHTPAAEPEVVPDGPTPPPPRRRLRKGRKPRRKRGRRRKAAAES
jgi:hypothetical protein